MKSVELFSPTLVYPYRNDSHAAILWKRRQISFRKEGNMLHTIVSRKLAARIFCIFLTSLVFATGALFAEDAPALTKTPFEKHGKLHVEGTQLVDKNSEPYQLYGMSTHGIAWFPMFVNEKTFTTLRD